MVQWNAIVVVQASSFNIHRLKETNGESVNDFFLSSIIIKTLSFKLIVNKSIVLLIKRFWSRIVKLTKKMIDALTL